MAEEKKVELEVNSNEELNEAIGKLTKDASINKPSDEEVKEAQKEFEKAVKDFTTKMYQIGEPEDAEEFSEYILHFIRNRFFWQKEAWMGTIKLVEEIEAAQGIFKEDKKKGLRLGYQALEFTFYALSNPGGLGYQAAKDFEEENELFIKIAQAVGDQLEGARKALKDIEFLQQKWGAMAQGFYLEVEPEGEEGDEEEDLPPGVEEEDDTQE